jgi:GNAT superfamily N-acetyltransferase
MHSIEVSLRDGDQRKSRREEGFREGFLNTLQIRPINEDDRSWLTPWLKTHAGDTVIVSPGGVHQADERPGFVVMQDDQPIGLATYLVDNDQCELVTLHSLAEGIGVGSALISAVKEVAASFGCWRLWLVTTNDNLNALRFYQKRGFVLVGVHRNGMDEVRRIKPDVPLIGMEGIPLRDMIELEMPLLG